METPEPITCPRSLRDLWADPLAGEWLEREGAYSLVEKYVCKSHPVKRARFTSILTASQQDALGATLKRHEVEPPDLFVDVPGMKRFRFGAPVEVLRFSLTAGQRTSA